MTIVAPGHLLSILTTEKHVPGARERIDHVEAATPRTFAFYTQAPAGTSFGTKFEGLQVSFDLPQQIEGLYHAGSVGIIMSGWLGAANYGAICANKVDLHLCRELAPLAGDATPSPTAQPSR